MEKMGQNETVLVSCSRSRFSSCYHISQGVENMRATYMNCRSLQLYLNIKKRINVIAMFLGAGSLFPFTQQQQILLACAYVDYIII